MTASTTIVSGRAQTAPDADSALPSGRLTLYTGTQLEPVLARMARAAAVLLRPHAHVCVIGMRRRGAPLADRLCALMTRDEGLRPPLRADLTVKRYADDLTLLHPQTLLAPGEALEALDLRGHALLLVDDVLYTGRTVLRVVEHLSHKEPAAIHVAVLADRGCTRVPVHADVAGLRLDVAPGDIVECHVPPFEPQWGIDVVKPLIGFGSAA